MPSLSNVTKNTNWLLVGMIAAGILLYYLAKMERNQRTTHRELAALRKAYMVNTANLRQSMRQRQDNAGEGVEVEKVAPEEFTERAVETKGVEESGVKVDMDEDSESEAEPGEAADIEKTPTPKPAEADT